MVAISQMGFAQEDIQFHSLFDHTLNPDVACYRIPALATAPNGDLIAAVDERVPSCADLRSNRNINIVIRRSHDNGISWRSIETLVDYADGQSASDPSMIVDNVNGIIFLFFNYMNLDEENGIYYLKMIKSHDNGETWSDPIDITSQITEDGWQQDFKFITSGRGIQTNSGMLLHTLVNLDKGLYLFGSDDHGTTWRLISPPLKPGDESKVIEFPDGSLMINSRVNNLGFRYVHTSTDMGRSWTSKPDSSLIDPGCNAAILSYTHQPIRNQSYILFTNPRMKSSRENLTLLISSDKTGTWPVEKVLYKGSSAYSTMTILKNGQVGLLFEKDNYSQITFIRLEIDSLLEK